MRPFQIVVIGIFAGLALLGFIFISVYQGGGSEEDIGYGDSVVLWGTFDELAVNQVLAEFQKTDKNLSVVKYEQKFRDTFDLDLLNAIAENRAPDLIILKHEGLIAHRAKLYPITFETIPERAFRDTYIDGAEIFLRPDGVYGIPFAVDPMVMYWNRDIFSSNGLASPPKTWEELVSVTTPTLTQTDSKLNISQSTVAFGEYTNVRFAKKILSMLLLQAGTNLVEEGRDRYQITLNDVSTQGALSPGESTLSFYTQFAVPEDRSYSWNRSQPDDDIQFLAGELALYFAPGSTYYDLERENPNLNFDIAEVPQGAGVSVRRNYGDFYAFAIPRASKNIFGAYQVANVLSSENGSDLITSELNLAPVRRSLLASGTNDSVRKVLYTAALISRGWLDPNPVASENIFRTMIEDVTSGRSGAGASVSDAAGRLRLLFE